jgi:hypothetical protein
VNEIEAKEPTSLSPSPAPLPVISMPELSKLSKEAFRLHRTIQNFLCTHEPALMIPNVLKNNDEDEEFSSKLTDQILLEDKFNSSINSKIDFDDITLQSTTVENSKKNHKSAFPAKTWKRFSTTEDESGFSSMSSFHEIGLPLNPPSVDKNSLRDDLSNKSSNSSSSNGDNEKLKADENSFRVLWV